MTSQERVIRAMHFQPPDRIPHYLPDGKENDILWMTSWTVGKGLEPPEIQPWKNFGEIDKRIDAWGVTWERPAGKQGNMGMQKFIPLLTSPSRRNINFPIGTIQPIM